MENLTMDTMELEAECEHEYTFDISGNSFCLKCGLERTVLSYGLSESLFNRRSYSISHIAVKSTEKSIVSHLNKLNIPERVKGRAEEIFTRLHSPNRKNHRIDLMIFYCLYNAYIELG